MGIQNVNEYVITPHASERIKQRFGQTHRNNATLVEPTLDSSSI
ncbi:hypothetical protein [Ligilactobacillus murinus]|nr:hypothetical protein [Ligilactobacillus murinus]